MDSKQIKKELAARGFDFSMLAEAIDKSPSLVSKVASRKATSRLVAVAIAKALERPVADIFPDVDAYHHASSSDEERKKKQRELVALLNK
jgi:ribosome-binding protein aMBF1 (putative translation factor)